MTPEFQPGVKAAYEKNPDYWGQAPKIDQLIFAITPDANVRLQN